MLGPLFHAWERQLASVTRDRVVRPFEWGLEWIPPNGHRSGTTEPEVLGNWVSSVMADTDTFFTPTPTDAYHLTGRGDGDALLTFPSALPTPHPENNTVYCRYFPAGGKRKTEARSSGRAAVLVLPQWNADAEGHVGLCRILAWSGLSTLRLALPYHDQRMPPE